MFDDRDSMPPGKQSRTTSVLHDALFPSAAELLFAVRGRRGGDSPLLGWARELAALYQELLADCHGRPQLRVQITAVIAAIDSWTASRLPRPRGGPVMCTESLGSVVARLAEVQVGACRVLMQLPPADQRVHRAWEQLAELREGYDDLIPAVTSGRVELPKSWRGIEDIERDLKP